MSTVATSKESLRSGSRTAIGHAAHAAQPLPARDRAAPWQPALREPGGLRPDAAPRATHGIRARKFEQRHRAAGTPGLRPSNWADVGWRAPGNATRSRAAGAATAAPPPLYLEPTGAAIGAPGSSVAASSRPWNHTVTSTPPGRLTQMPALDRRHSPPAGPIAASVTATACSLPVQPGQEHHAQDLRKSCKRQLVHDERRLSLLSNSSHATAARRTSASTKAQTPQV
jgi:hypothetical protein